MQQVGIIWFGIDLKLKQDFRGINVNFASQELNYIEVCFDKKPTNPFKIHGLEQRSEYVEVDFTKKVDPLPDSEKDDVSDDDFVSLEDVKSMKRKTLAHI